MKNDGTMFLRLFSEEIYYPEEVFPFEYKKIMLFTSNTDGYWRVTEKRTGFRIGEYGHTEEEVIKSVKSAINFRTPAVVKRLIRDAAKNIKAGLVYDGDSKEWREPIEQVL